MISAELSLLSICFTYPDLLPKVRTLVQPYMFLDIKNNAIYNAALDLYDTGASVDNVTVSSHILNNKKLSSKFSNDIDVQDSIMNIRDVDPVADNFKDYTVIIVNNYRKSHAAKVAEKTAKNISDGADASSEVEALSETVQELERASTRPFNSFLGIAEEEINEMTKREEQGEQSMNDLFVPTPFESVNNFIYGFRYGSLSLLGARPAVGKTTVAVALAADAAKRGIKTLFISIEMNKNEIAQKMFSHTSGVHFNKLLEMHKFEQGDWDAILKMRAEQNEIWAKNLSVDDTSETPAEVMRSINWAINEGYKYIIIDHLHELPWGERRSHISLTEAMGDFVKRLRNKAQRNQVAVLALCQLNREVEKRSSKIPMASDLGESGALERVAHNILFLNRAEHHKGEVDVIIAKARGGTTGIATLDFDGGTNKVQDQTNNSVDWDTIN